MRGTGGRTSSTGGGGGVVSGTRQRARRRRRRRRRWGPTTVGRGSARRYQRERQRLHGVVGWGQRGSAAG
eukprot:COSAG01_NODE_94_length_26962_cov_9.110933_33_plen_70_part_00